MELKERLKRDIEHGASFTDKVLGEITQDEDWIRRPVPGSNHALWIAGHIGMATDYFIGLIDAEKSNMAEGYPKMFGKGSQPKDDLSEYPKPAEVFEYLRDRRTALIGVLDECSVEDLAREMPKGPGFMYDVGAVFSGAVWHEALHAGQLSVIHRMLGQTPVSDR